MIKKTIQTWGVKDWALLIAAIFFSFILVTLVSPVLLKAGFLAENWDDSLNQVSEVIRPPESYSGEGMLKNLVTNNVIPLFKYIFIGVSILFFVLSIFLMITAGGEEEEISKQRNALLWAMIGFVFIALAADVSDALNPIQNEGIDVDASRGIKVFQKIVTYLQLVLGLIAVVFTFYAGFRFVTAGDDEETIDQSKRHFFWGIMGLIVVILADPLVNNVFYPADGSPGIEETKSFTMEIMGVLKFILSFLGVLALIGLVFAGVLYITSFGSEERQNRAKQIIMATVIGIVIIASSYTAIVMFTPGGTS